jgi:dephospho-CoA kinase
LALTGTMASGRSVALTGGIGSGKSTAAAVLVELGAVLVDTDAIARALTAVGGQALTALAGEFGSDIVASDGALDRDRMRALAFADISAKARLEAILHPLIGDEALRQAALAGPRPVLFDVPLLTESSAWRRRVGRILVIDCLESTQIRRVQQRSGWSAQQVERVIAQQASRNARRAIADAVIFNDALTQAELARQLRTLWKHWQRAGI